MKRYDLEPYATDSLVETPEGAWVRHEEADAEITELREDIARLERRLHECEEVPYG